MITAESYLTVITIIIVVSLIVSISATTYVTKSEIAEAQKVEGGMEKLLDKHHLSKYKKYLKTSTSNTSEQSTPIINVTLSLFKSITRVNTHVASLLTPFDTIYANKDNTVTGITDFNIVTYINIINSNIDDNSTIKVKLVLARDNQEGMAITLNEQEIEAKDLQKEITTHNTTYINYKYVTYVENIDLDIDNPLGKYIIKAYIKTNKQSDYTLASMLNLTVA